VIIRNRNQTCCCATKIAIQRYIGETKLKVVLLFSRVERDKTLGEIVAIPNFLLARWARQGKAE
jgi:hypothetical protein